MAPALKVATTAVGPAASGASTMWPPAVSYAIVDALTNCGDTALGSRVQRFFALAGSWMSRTTTIGSPATVPITRLSPAGTEAVQCTSDAGPAAGVELGVV